MVRQMGGATRRNAPSSPKTLRGWEGLGLPSFLIVEPIAPLGDANE